MFPENLAVPQGPRSFTKGTPVEDSTEIAYGFPSAIFVGFGPVISRVTYSEILPRIPPDIIPGITPFL